jgi:dTDP-4-amino-4,6-dideoxygalactose transaminase
LLSGIDGPLLPSERSGVRHVYHQYTVRIADDRRDEARAALADSGVDTLVYYPTPVHQLPVYEALEVRAPQAEKAAREVLSLPMGPRIERAAQQRVAESIERAMRGR